MISSVDLQKIRGKVYSAFFADGMWDILLGLFIMAITFYIGPVMWPVLSLICYIVGYLVVLRIREQVTYPRIGYAKEPGNNRFSIMLRLCFAMLLMLAMFAALQYFVVYSSDAQTWLSPFLRYLRNAVFAATIVFVAYRYDVKRWYLYALWIFVGFSFGRALLFPAFGSLENSPWPTNFTYHVTGGVILLAGVVTLIRFLRNNPVMVEEELDEQA